MSTGNVGSIPTVSINFLKGKNMKFSDFYVGQRVKVYQQANPNGRGPSVGSEGTVVEVGHSRDDAPRILVDLKKYGQWYFVDCAHDSYHHRANECFCMLKKPYSWRKL